MLELARIYLFVFGALTIAGGVMGFVKAKSRPSLIAGSISGGLLLFAGYLVARQPTVGFVIGLVVSFALTARFGMVFRKSRRIMPAGLMTALGLAGIVLSALVLSGG
ncbi:MAG: TMEM14 family protein [Polyangiaceae bacterium]